MSGISPNLQVLIYGYRGSEFQIQKIDTQHMIVCVSTAATTSPIKCSSKLAKTF